MRHSIIAASAVTPSTVLADATHDARSRRVHPGARVANVARVASESASGPHITVTALTRTACIVPPNRDALQLRRTQAQCVDDDRNRAEAHRGGREHG